MSFIFNGSAELPNAYEVCLTDSGVDLVIIRGALGQSAVDAVRNAANLDEMEERTSRFHEILYSELPLTQAEKLIEQWYLDSDLPEELVAYSTLEAPVAERRGRTVTHFDTSIASDDVITSPFAISVGTSGTGLFRGLRLKQDLTNEEILGTVPASILKTAEIMYTDEGQFLPGVETSRLLQSPGDVVLIPGARRPSQHGVELVNDEPRSSVISSYVMTAKREMSPADLRKSVIARNTFVANFVAREFS